MKCTKNDTMSISKLLIAFQYNSEDSGLVFKTDHFSIPSDVEDDSTLCTDDSVAECEGTVNPNASNFDIQSSTSAPSNNRTAHDIHSKGIIFPEEEPDFLANQTLVEGSVERKRHKYVSKTKKFLAKKVKDIDRHSDGNHKREYEEGDLSVDNSRTADAVDKATGKAMRKDSHNINNIRSNGKKNSMKISMQNSKPHAAASKIRAQSPMINTAVSRRSMLFVYSCCITGTCYRVGRERLNATWG